MKQKIFISIFALLLSAQYVVAQIDAPQPSPFVKVEQMVGTTKVNLEYSRPSVKGRVIFGDLVPFDEYWRTGANKNTILTFDDDVIIGNESIAKGSYALFTKPGKSSWDILLYSEIENWGTPDSMKKDKIVVRYTVTPKKTTKVETFTISIDNLKSSRADIVLSWDTTKVSIPLEVPTNKKVMASIKEVMASGEAKADDYYTAAVYYLENNKDFKQAKTWIDKAVKEKSDAFWYLRRQALIYVKLGMKKEAIAIAKKSKELAQKAGNSQYVKMNNKSIVEWSN